MGWILEILYVFQEIQCKLMFFFFTCRKSVSAFDKLGHEKVNFQKCVTEKKKLPNDNIQLL